MAILAGLSLPELVEFDPDRIWGVDVSHYQGEPDFTQVRDAGARFVFVKATEGRTVRDKRFQRNWLAAQEAGLPRGAYHVAHLIHDGTVTDARGGARNLLSQTDGGELPLVLDLETRLLKAMVRARGARAAHDWIGEWIDEVLQATGRAPMLYVSQWTAYLLGDEAGDLPRLDTWWADYRRGDGAPRRRGWPSWRLRQHGTGAVPGVSGLCDLSFFSGGAAEWARWLNVAWPPVESDAGPVDEPVDQV